ncbi:MAG TPA: excisionase family DNA-binding protein [Pyrinomonadaceae bacterium]|nr:excisionase family DNA-binding protein [Pyrinomonadaceae bacterium]
MNSLIGTKEAAIRLGISMRRVQALIAAGRLPAEKVGNSFAIKEADLKKVNGRKNGKPAADRAGFGASQGASRGKLGAAHKAAVNKPPEERTQEEWDTILDRILGSVSLGPDRSTNKKWMADYGR